MVKEVKVWTVQRLGRTAEPQLYRVIYKQKVRSKGDPEESRSKVNFVKQFIFVAHFVEERQITSEMSVISYFKKWQLCGYGNILRFYFHSLII